MLETWYFQGHIILWPNNMVLGISESNKHYETLQLLEYQTLSHTAFLGIINIFCTEYLGSTLKKLWHAINMGIINIMVHIISWNNEYYGDHTLFKGKCVVAYQNKNVWNAEDCTYKMSLICKHNIGQTA